MTEAAAMLTEAARERVEEAVRRAEVGTAGEIVVVLARRAGSYKAEPLAYALLAALLVPWPLIALTDLAAPRILTLQALVAVATLVTVALLGHRAVPGVLKRRRARDAAAREFAGRGMTDTRGRTGVLLYVARVERYAEVLGDVAIAGRVAEAEWREVIESLVNAMGEGGEADALIAAVERIGAILARHVPPGEHDRDELPNRVVVL